MTAPRHRVVVLLLEPVVGYDATIPIEFLSSTAATGEPLYDVVTAGLTRDPVSTSSGYALVPAADASVLASADTVIVPGTRVGGIRTGGSLPAEVLEALALIRPGTRIVSICTGAFVLAAAGFLDGRPATTHWAYADDLRRVRPQVQVLEDQLFVDDGDVLTSAGLSAGVDLCLHLIRRDHGPVAANRVARYCVVPPWREGGQAQFIDRPVPRADAESTGAVRSWALEHLDQPLDVARLAERASMSRRTFIRRFGQETGQTPAAWVAAQRLRLARQLLEESDLSVDAVATRSGLGTAANLRVRLRAEVGVSPQAYRRTFRQTA